MEVGTGVTRPAPSQLLLPLPARPTSPPPGAGGVEAGAGAGAGERVALSAVLSREGPAGGMMEEDYVCVVVGGGWGAN